MSTRQQRRHAQRVAASGFTKMRREAAAYVDRARARAVTNGVSSDDRIWNVVERAAKAGDWQTARALCNAVEAVAHRFVKLGL